MRKQAEEANLSIEGSTRCSDAPAILLGVFEGPLHLLMQNLKEARGAHRLCAGLRNVRRAITRAENANERLLHPIRFQAKPKGFAEHHRGAEDRANRVGDILSRKGRCGTVNWLKRSGSGGLGGVDSFR